MKCRIFFLISSFLLFSQAQAQGFADALQTLITTGQASIIIQPGTEKAILTAQRLEKNVKYTIQAEGKNRTFIHLLTHPNETVGFTTKRQVPARTDVYQNDFSFKHTGVDPNKDQLMLSIRNSSSIPIFVTLILKIKDQ